MGSNDVLPQVSRSEKNEFFDHSTHDSEELHVLAVDDSLVDRKVVERLLKISSCKVTAVDSGRRALQFLGLDGEKSSVGLDDLKVNMIITDYCMLGMTGYELLKKIKVCDLARCHHRSFHLFLFLILIIIVTVITAVVAILVADNVVTITINSLEK